MNATCRHDTAHRVNERLRSALLATRRSGGCAAPRNPRKCGHTLGMGAARGGDQACPLGCHFLFGNVQTIPARAWRVSAARRSARSINLTGHGMAAPRHFPWRALLTASRFEADADTLCDLIGASTAGTIAINSSPPNRPMMVDTRAGPHNRPKRRKTSPAAYSKAVIDRLEMIG